MIGISTALEFARDGHQVTVYEQMNATAEDASFAPGGWLSPLAVQSLAAPGSGAPLKLLQSHSGLLHTSNMLASPTWRWMRQWKKSEKLSSQDDSKRFSTALHALSNYSSSLRWQDCEDPSWAAERTTGNLVLLRTTREVAFWSAKIPYLQEQGIACRILDPQQALLLEPGLGLEISWVSALHFPSGESINPRLWTQHLRIQAQAVGINFHTSTSVQEINTEPVGIKTNAGLHPYDTVVVCAGANTSLLKALGIRLPLMPTWGYSITAPVRSHLQAPRNAVMDWAEQVIISRMGERIRITGGLEMNRNAASPHHHQTLQRMYNLLNNWFPGGAHLSSPQVQVWRGVRGYLPDGLPAVGSSRHPNIWLNMGHGSHGASLAAGCARAIADLANNQSTAIDMQAFSPLRF